MSDDTTYEPVTHLYEIHDDGRPTKVHAIPLAQVKIRQAIHRRNFLRELNVVPEHNRPRTTAFDKWWPLTRGD